MKRIVAASALVTAATVVSAQPNQPYNCVRDSELRPVFCTGLRPIVTAEMGIPIGTPFFDSSASALYYWSGSSWAGPNALFSDGTASAPSIAFASSPTTGLHLGKPSDSLGVEDESGAMTLNDYSLMFSTPPTCSWANSGCAGNLTVGNVSAAVTAPLYEITRGSQTALNLSGTVPAGKGTWVFGNQTHILSTADASGTGVAYLYPNYSTVKLASGSVDNAVSNLYSGVTAATGSVSLFDRYSYVDVATGTTHGSVIVEELAMFLGDTSTAAEFTVLKLAGPREATDGADSTKIFKLYAYYYGRSLINQPRDTDYALELTNGQGLSVSGKTNQLQLSKAAGGAKPACASGTRGSFWYEPGGTDVKDTVEVCAKDGANAYDWRTIY